MIPKISIVIPVYNAGAFLDELINSLLSLNYANFEVIFVNDGSDDNSYEKLSNIASEYKKFKVITQNNQGVAVARNVGIANACGDWLFFLDADDYLSPNYFDFVDEKNVENDMSPHSIIIIDGVYDDYGEKKIKWDPVSQKYINADNIKFTLNSKIMKYVWGKLYKREFLKDNNVIFEKYKIAEDFLFNFQLCLHGASIKVVNSGFYYYKQNPTAVTKLFKADNLLSRFKVVTRIEELLCQSESAVLVVQKLYMEFFLYQTLKHINKTSFEDKKEILSVIKRNRKYINMWQIPFLSLKLKGKIYFFLLLLKYRLW